MIEKDNIQELFSKAFENQTSTVRPEVWAGVQAKMAAAGVASTATVATKGLSALTKWIIGSAAVGTVGVVTAVVALNSGEESTNKKTDTPKEVSQNITVSSPEEKADGEQKTVAAQPIHTKPDVVTNEPFEDNPQVTNPSGKEYKSSVNPEEKQVVAADRIADDKGKPEEKIATTDNSKKESNEKSDSRKSPVDKKEDVKEIPSARYPEDSEKPVFAALEAKVTKFPTIFTPNGDRSNDTYFVTVENINDFQLVIIDQNNHEMFRTNNPSDEWNGTNKAGEEAPSGSYAAIVTGKQQNGKSFRDIQLFELRR